MNRKFWLTLISLLLTVTLAGMVYLGLLALQEEYRWTFSVPFKDGVNQETAYVETKTINESITYQNQLTIKNHVGNISIVGEDTNEITVLAEVEVISNDPKRTTALVEQTRLIVENNASTSIMAVLPTLEDEEQVFVDLTVTVPQQIVAIIDAKCGTIQMENLAGEIEAKTGLGNIVIKDYTGNAMFNSDSGDISVKNAQFTEDLQVYSGLGDVHVQGKLAKQTSFHLNLGDLSIQLPEAEDLGYHLIASFPGGTFVTQLPLTGKQTDIDVDGTLGIASEDQLLINVALGSINITYFEEEKHD